MWALCTGVHFRELVCGTPKYFSALQCANSSSNYNESLPTMKLFWGKKILCCKRKLYHPLHLRCASTVKFNSPQTDGTGTEFALQPGRMLWSLLSLISTIFQNSGQCLSMGLHLWVLEYRNHVSVNPESLPSPLISIKNILALLAKKFFLVSFGVRSYTN